jgi:methylmalonyl-CoA mutase N-terminal domain/subunit
MIFLLWAFITSETGREKRPQAEDFAVHWATASWSFTGTVRD